MLLSQVVVPSLVSALGCGLSPIFHKLNMEEQITISYLYFYFTVQL